jgi:hypothetical protein
MGASGVYDISANKSPIAAIPTLDHAVDFLAEIDPAGTRAPIVQPAPLGTLGDQCLKCWRLPAR